MVRLSRKCKKKTVGFENKALKKHARSNKVGASKQQKRVVQNTKRKVTPRKKATNVNRRKKTQPAVLSAEKTKLICDDDNVHLKARPNKRKQPRERQEIAKKSKIVSTPCSRCNEAPQFIFTTVCKDTVETCLATFGNALEAAFATCENPGKATSTNGCENTLKSDDTCETICDEASKNNESNLDMSALSPTHNENTHILLTC